MEKFVFHTTDPWCQKLGDHQPTVSRGHVGFPVASFQPNGIDFGHLAFRTVRE